MAGTTPRLAGNAVHVWRVELTRGPVGSALAEEEQRAERMRDQQVRARFLASRVWLRAILGRYIDIEPDALRFKLGRRGKPSVVGGGDLCFSLSRSAGVALIAVTRGRAVGVDIELERADLEPEILVERFFAAAEVGALAGLPELAYREAFFRLWVRKEAVVKASGAGIGDGLTHINVLPDIVAGRWSVASLDVGIGYAGAVAVDGTMGTLSHYEPVHGPPVWSFARINPA